MTTNHPLAAAARSSYRARHLQFRTGAPGRNRTCNRRLRRPVLYPVELRARERMIAVRMESNTPDSAAGIGRGRGIRTPDILLPKQARYQTALYPAVQTVARLQYNRHSSQLAIVLIETRPVNEISFILESVHDLRMLRAELRNARHKGGEREWMSIHDRTRTPCRAFWGSARRVAQQRGVCGDRERAHIDRIASRCSVRREWTKEPGMLAALTTTPYGDRYA